MTQVGGRMPAINTYMASWPVDPHAASLNPKGPNSGVTQDILNLCQVVCRLHELIREHVWKIRMLSIL